MRSDSTLAIPGPFSTVSWSHIMFAVASPGSIEPAVMNKAMRLASALNAELELFHCIFDLDVAHPGRFASRGIEEDVRECVEQRRKRLERTAGRLRGHGVKVRSSVRWDYPAYEGIVRQVLRHKPHLLIVQSTRRGRAARLMLTHTDYKLIETCPCPVLLIKTTRPYMQTCTIAAVDPLHARDKPAALDDAILDSAAVVSNALSEKLLVYHARTPWADAARRTPGLRWIPDVVQSDAQTAYEEKIEGQVMDLARRHDVKTNRVHVGDGDVAESLPQFARGESADIVAMGAVSRSLLKRVLIGHTAERLLDALNCDLLVVKPPGFRTPVSRQSAHLLDRSLSQHARYIW